MGTFLRITYDVPVANAGLAQAAAIKLGGVASRIELIEEVETFTKNKPKLLLKAPKKLKRKTGKSARAEVEGIIAAEFAKSETITAKAMKAQAKKLRIPPTTVQYYIGQELEAKRMESTGKRGEYRRKA